MRVVAFYLPQFYPTATNDRWYGAGHTEWTNVRRARPLYRGHYQPRVPGELGYYDLRDADVRRRQAELARAAGIEGFCYYHYWFGDGVTELDEPLRQVLESGEPDFPFCLCWANESWYAKHWGLGGRPTKRLIHEQRYEGVRSGAAPSRPAAAGVWSGAAPSRPAAAGVQANTALEGGREGAAPLPSEDAAPLPSEGAAPLQGGARALPPSQQRALPPSQQRALPPSHFMHVLPALRDRRYMRVEGRMLFMIYRPLEHPYLKEWVEEWRSLAREHLGADFYFVGHARTDEEALQALALGLDGVNIMRKDAFRHGRGPMLWEKVQRLVGRAPYHYPYAEVSRYFVDREGIETRENVFPTIIPGWDHSARRGKSGIIFDEATPELFGRHVEDAVAVCAAKAPERRLAFLLSWNEWGEGNYLEPDARYGRAFIDTLREKIDNHR